MSMIVELAAVALLIVIIIWLAWRPRPVQTTVLMPVAPAPMAAMLPSSQALAVAADPKQMYLNNQVVTTSVDHTVDPIDQVVNY
jgi:hypothetical protein